ncbi:MAG: hypothetical protein M3Y85_00735, partial [Bacteroidota bacterium]|nr:hypothetical protein [Bacteroidota bacterium]
KCVAPRKGTNKISPPIRIISSAGSLRVNIFQRCGMRVIIGNSFTALQTISIHYLLFAPPLKPKA